MPEPMKFFVVSAIASRLHLGRNVNSVNAFVVRAHSEIEAIGYGQRDIEGRLPAEDGWMAHKAWATEFDPANIKTVEELWASL